MDKQKVYNKVKKHLLSQKMKSMDCGNCAYRGENGLKCAIGCLIPNKNYNSGIEGYTIYAKETSDTLYGFAKPETDDETFFLAHLQSVHDKYPVKKWESKLKIVAKKYNLKG